MSEEPAGRRERLQEAVREIVLRRERAPRSPRLERALKRLIWRYSRQLEEGSREAEALPPQSERTSRRGQTQAKPAD